MERVLSVDEKIKRAEEIYNRKIADKAKKTSATVNVTSYSKHGKTKKMLLQIAICFSIYLIYYLIQNGNYIFSEEVIKKTNEILNYNINIQQYYENIKQMITGDLANNNLEEQNNTTNEQQEVENTSEAVNTSSENTSQENLETPTLSATESVQESSSINQMDLDSAEIKKVATFIVPLTGTITSRFGVRNPTTETVPKYHTGIDIARDEGTVIVASMGGTVSLVSTEGDYGNQIRISNGDVVTLYAHCSDMYVKEGDVITQGQQIAEVGSTGNVTGPHLHFEIRYQDRIVDPEYILGEM